MNAASLKHSPHLLMCPPDYFGIEYEINAWMHREQPADRALAQQQWRDLHALIVASGAKVSLLEPQPNLPDLVFTANAALIYRDRAILAHFRHAERQREEPFDRAWLAANGFRVESPPCDMYFEGAGDALFCGDTLFAGYRIRSDARGHQQIGAALGCRVIPLELVDPRFYHLDTCFCPLAPGLAAWYPAAFDHYGQTVIREMIPQLIEVNPEESASFACNAVVVGRQVFTNVGCPELHSHLLAHAFEPHATPLSEFVKAGGSAKCLTLRLDGEEAALWPIR